MLSFAAAKMSDKRGAEIVFAREMIEKRPFGRAGESSNVGDTGVIETFLLHQGGPGIQELVLRMFGLSWQCLTLRRGLVRAK